MAGHGWGTVWGAPRHPQAPGNKLLPPNLPHFHQFELFSSNFFDKFSPSKAQPIPQRGKEGVVLPFVTWAGTGQACSSTFVHASSWPNTVLVMVRQNFSLFLTPRHGGVASVASQKPMPVPPRKNSCPCNAAGRLAFAY